MVTKADIQQAIQALGLANQPLCIHASLRSCGWVEGGARTIIDALAALVEKTGSIILMGVGLECMTLLHLAEQQAGRNLFRRWANDRNGETIEVEMGGCSDGFGKLEPILVPLVRETQVGQSHWRLLPARETLALAAAAIRRDPLLTHCGRSPCRCDDAVLGGPLLS